VKQQINFYTRLVPPRAVPKTLIGISIACSITVLAYFVTAVYLLNQQQNMDVAVKEAEQKNNQLKIEIENRQMLDAAVDLQSLEKTLKNLTQQRERLEVLITGLQDPTLSKVNGFSAAMTGLSRQHVKGIAVQKFELTHRGRQFSMAGQLQNPTALPIYISKLGSEVAFHNMTFERINILETDGELDFEVMSLDFAKLGLAGSGS
tara:strand:- start:21438 stop:22052 length:615 start_codon:yes stop_codon:yes gene_type:complete